MFERRRQKRRGVAVQHAEFHPPRGGREEGRQVVEELTRHERTSAGADLEGMVVKERGVEIQIMNLIRLIQLHYLLLIPKHLEIGIPHVNVLS